MPSSIYYGWQCTNNGNEVSYIASRLQRNSRLRNFAVFSPRSFPCSVIQVVDSHPQNRYRTVTHHYFMQIWDFTHLSLGSQYLSIIWYHSHYSLGFCGIPPSYDIYIYSSRGTSAGRWSRCRSSDFHRRRKPCKKVRTEGHPCGCQWFSMGFYLGL